MKIKKGVVRIVFVFKSIVIKIPNFRYSHNHFLQGCCANWKERKYCKDFKDANYEGNMYEYVAPSFYCSIFGLIQIQAKCEPMLEDLKEEQKIFYKPLCGTDNKKENFGWYKNRLVCLDYA
jgi:hypothetical protein